MEYQEIELLRYGTYCLEYSQLVKFKLNKNDLNKLKPLKRTISDPSYSSYKEIEIIYLSDILDTLYKNGWEYKSTYWKGGDSNIAHKVLTFIKMNNEK